MLLVNVFLAQYKILHVRNELQKRFLRVVMFDVKFYQERSRSRCSLMAGEARRSR
jgi:hypothetical protein